MGGFIGDDNGNMKKGDKWTFNGNVDLTGNAYSTADNSRIFAFVMKKTANDKFYINNVTDCPVNGEGRLQTERLIIMNRFFRIFTCSLVMTCVAALSACSSGGDGNPLSLRPSKTSVLPDGKDEVRFTVTYEGQDVTAAAAIWQLAGGDLAADTKLEGAVFTTATAGTLPFRGSLRVGDGGARVGSRDCDRQERGWFGRPAASFSAVFSRRSSPQRAAPAVRRSARSWTRWRRVPNGRIAWCMPLSI